MRVEMRVYRQFDLDLYALAAAGYSLSRLFETTVTSFANGNPVYIVIDELNNFSIGDKTAFLHFCFKVDNRDTATVNLLQSAAPRMRTSLCKMILRNALGQQDLRCFFPDYPEIDRLMMIDANKRLLMNRPDTVPLSSFKVQTNIKDYAGIQVDMGVKQQGQKRELPGTDNTYGQYGSTAGNRYIPQPDAAPPANPYIPVQSSRQKSQPAQIQYGANPGRQKTYQDAPSVMQQNTPVQPAQHDMTGAVQQSQQSVPQSYGYEGNVISRSKPVSRLQPERTFRPEQPVQTGQPMQAYPPQQNVQLQHTQPVQQVVQSENNDQNVISDNVPAQQAQPVDPDKAPGTISDDLLNAFDNL